MFTITILPNDRSNPPGKLAEAELHFIDVSCECVLCESTKVAAIQLASGDHRLDPCDGCNGTGRQSNPLAGLKLIGFGIWERRGGSGRNVTFPARLHCRPAAGLRAVPRTRPPARTDGDLSAVEGTRPLRQEGREGDHALSAGDLQAGRAG
jgi:hypothetical protein